MPCSTLVVDSTSVMTRPVDVSPSSEQEDADVCPTKPKLGLTTTWIQNDDRASPVTGRIALPDVGNNFRCSASTSRSGSHPGTDDGGGGGSGGPKQDKPISNDWTPDFVPLPSANKTHKTKTKRKKVKSRDKARSRKKKKSSTTALSSSSSMSLSQPVDNPEEARTGKTAGNSETNKRLINRKRLCPIDVGQPRTKNVHRPLSEGVEQQKIVVRNRAFSTSACIVAPSGGPKRAPPLLGRAISVGEPGDRRRLSSDFGVGDTNVRLPRISQSNGSTATLRPAELSLKKSSSNPEIPRSSTGGVNERTSAKPTNTQSVAQTNNNNSNNRQNRTPQNDDKKRPQVALLVAIKPENQESEREKFFKQRFNYNPQFTYRYPANPAVLERYSHPTSSLLPVAEKIMNHAIEKYGSFEKFVETTGGKKLNRSQIVESAKKYLKKEGMLDEVSVRLSEDILSRACMTRFRGQPTLQVRINEIRELWMEGLLRHELGTHYIRSSNNRNQEWYKWRRRREMNLRPFNPTEEGIAALHSIISRPEPSLFRSALLYYTAFKASEMSFSQLFKDIGRFVKDPNVRWDYCMRAKRGQTDTSEPGTFSKDQVYLTGALSILKHRANIDFHALFRCGKVDFRDVDRLKEVADLQNTRIPGFMADLKQYRRSLDEIVIRNGLTDEDLEAAV